MAQSSITSFFGRISKRKHADESETDTSIASTSQDENDDMNVGAESNENAMENEAEMATGSGGKLNADSLKKQKQSRTFHEEWKEGRPWLKYIPKEGIYCLWCQKYNKKPFGHAYWNSKACARIQLPSVKNHEQSNEHKDSVKLELMNCADIVSQLREPEHVRMDAMVQAFQCLYWLCRNKVAHTTNFEKLLDLATLLGLDIKGKI